MKKKREIVFTFKRGGIMFGLFKKKKQTETIEESFLNANPKTLNSLSPDSIIIEDDYIRSGGNYTKTYVIPEYEQLIDRKLIQEMSEISENISFTYHIEKISNEEVRKSLSRSIEQSETLIDSKNVKEHRKAEAEAQRDNAKAILKKLAYRNERLYYFNALIHIVAKSKEELGRLETSANAVCTQFGRLMYPRLKNKEAFQSMLPLNSNKIKEMTYRSMSAGAVSYFFPFHENEIIMDNGIIVGKNRQTNNIVKIDDNALLNKHKFIVGISGSGKSTYLFSDMARKKAFNKRIFTIDPKGEFGDPYEAMGGQNIVFTKNKGGSTINIFDLPTRSISIHADDDTYETTKFVANPLSDHISQLLITFNLMYPEMTTEMETELTKILTQLYDIHGFSIEKDKLDLSEVKATDYPILEDLYNYMSVKEHGGRFTKIQEKSNESIEKIEVEVERDSYAFDTLQPFYKKLEQFVAGIYKNVFNNHTNIKIENRLVCFDIQDVTEDENLSKIVYFNVLNYIKTTILSSPEEDTFVYIDEGHYIADPKVVLAMKHLFIMMKVFRSLNTGVVVATQSIEDFLSAKDEHRNYGESVILQSTQRLILPMQENEVDVINEKLRLRLTEDDKQSLKVISGEKTDETGKGFYYVGAKKVKIQVELTELEKALWFDKNFEIFDERIKQIKED